MSYWGLESFNVPRILRVNAILPKLLQFTASKYGARILLALVVLTVLALTADPVGAANKCAPWRVSC